MTIYKPLTLLSSSYKSYQFLRSQRVTKRYCPRCKTKVFWKLKDRTFKCKKCFYKFNDFTKTYIGKIKIDYNEMVHLIYLFVLGVPGYRIRNYSEVSLKTIQKVYTTIRTAIYDTTVDEMKEAYFSGQIEMDETMFGGRRSGKRGWGSSGKHMIFGLYQRNGTVLTFPISSRNRKTLLPIIDKHVKQGSLYYTDNWHAYSSLCVRGNHVVVTKDKGIPKGRNHINGIEGFWSFAKHWLYQYRGVPKHHFHLYLKEIEFRFNHRNQNLFLLLSKLLTNLVQNRS
jgi:transposase